MLARDLLIAVALCLVACGSNVGSETSSGNCDAYLDCLAETDPDEFEAEIGVYGNNGSCFADADDDDCQTACLGKLESLGRSEEACEPPPEPEPEPGSDPKPDASGYVDCAAVAGGNTVGPGEPGPLGFPETACNPRTSGMGESRCCSDDPAAVGGALPAYQNVPSSGSADPYFAGANNGVGTSGLCVRTGDIPSGSGLFEAAAANCPLPCNPTWDDSDVGAVCGQNRVCCQTREIQPEDCVRDPDGSWRPATGDDVLAGVTDWRPDRHATHQDPNGNGCTQAVGTSDGPEFLDCVAQLSVADQRGFCMALQPGEGCPGEIDGYLDACEQINAGLIPPPF